MTATSTLKPLAQPVLLNDFKRLWQDIGPDVLAATKAFGESGWYVLGENVKQFEKALAAKWEMNQAVGVASGLDALEIGLRALGLKTGDKVLTTPLSAFATTLAILRAGGVPVYVDVDENGLLDLDKCRALLEKEKIAYMVPVHLYGHALDLKKLEALKNDFNLKIVEDCAQSIRATSYDRFCGTVGQIAATSFYPTKNLGAFGDAGALLMNTVPHYDAARSLRDYGQSQKYVHDHLGLNSRLDELQAAILHKVCLPQLIEWTLRRQAIANDYIEGINNPAIIIPEQPEHSDSVWHLFPTLIEKRDEFMAYMKEHGVHTGIHYPILITEQKALTDAVETVQIQGDLVNANRFAQCEVSLPIHPYLTDDEVDHVIQLCNQWKPSV